MVHNVVTSAFAQTTRVQDQEQEQPEKGNIDHLACPHKVKARTEANNGAFLSNHACWVPRSKAVRADPSAFFLQGSEEVVSRNTEHETHRTCRQFHSTYLCRVGCNSPVLARFTVSRRAPGQYRIFCFFFFANPSSSRGELCPGEPCGTRRETRSNKPPGPRTLFLFFLHTHLFC